MGWFEPYELIIRVIGAFVYLLCVSLAIGVFFLQFLVAERLQVPDPLKGFG